MKIYDCFMFMNELELLELRLETLYNVVDYFVLVEVGKTFTGKPKSFYFEENEELFEKYKDKIIKVKLNNLLHENTTTREAARENEFYNRNLITHGIVDVAPDDYIIISDVDEIINPVALKTGVDANFDFFTLKQKLFYYYVNCLQRQSWNGPVVFKKKLMKTPQEMRRLRGSGIQLINDGGWHYSFLGGIDKIKVKLNAYAETQTNTTSINNEEHIKKCLENGDDLFLRKGNAFEKNFIELNAIGHPELNDWLEKYPEMIKL